MVGTCCEAGRGVRGEEDEKASSRNPKEGTATEEVERLYKGGLEGDREDRRGRKGQSKMEDCDPHRRPHLSWIKVRRRRRRRNERQDTHSRL